MTPTADLMKLVEKWREEAAELRAKADSHSNGDYASELHLQANERENRADELHAALSSTGETRVGGEVPVTAAMLADAFGCFWNAALDRARNSDDAQTAATVGAIVEGFGAVSARLQEFATLTAPGADDEK